MDSNLDVYGIQKEVADKIKFSSKKKDTKKWCLGHVGVEHEKEVRQIGWSGCFTYEVCKECGKHLKYLGMTNPIKNYSSNKKT